MKKILTITITTIILLSILTNPNININAQTTNPLALTITGLVDNPTNLTITELKTLPKTTIYAALICVDFPQSIVEEGNWTGVKLATLLETATIKPGAVKIIIAAGDGYSSDLSVDDAKQDDVILAYEKDGQALSGLRLVVPGRWGYKWVNMVAKIEVVDYDYIGFWESRGYSDSAIVGQDPGVSGGVKPPKPTFSTTPLPAPTINPSTTPSPTASQNTSTGTQATQSPNQNPTQTNNIPAEAIYAIAIGIVVAIAASALLVHKKLKK
jgi:DMSO/TMAO reductase YedYZ molybdopterin-dependent catalytic subunit